MTFEEFQNIIQDRITQIDPISGEFALDIHRRVEDDGVGTIKVLCNGVLFVTFT